MSTCKVPQASVVRVCALWYHFGALTLMVGGMDDIYLAKTNLIPRIAEFYCGTGGGEGLRGQLVYPDLPRKRPLNGTSSSGDGDGGGGGGCGTLLSLCFTLSLESTPFISLSASFWYQFFHFRLTYSFTHHFFLFCFTSDFAHP